MYIIYYCPKCVCIYNQFYSRTLIETSHDFETIHVTKNKKGCRE